MFGRVAVNYVKLLFGLTEERWRDVFFKVRAAVLDESTTWFLPQTRQINSGFRGGKGDLHPPLAASNVFCVNNCTSPSNDYTAVECSNNDQVQLNTHVSVPY